MPLSQNQLKALRETKTLLNSAGIFEAKLIEGIPELNALRTTLHSLCTGPTFQNH
jgi:hypothetical protein